MQDHKALFEGRVAAQMMRNDPGYAQQREREKQMGAQKPTPTIPVTDVEVLRMLKADVLEERESLLRGDANEEEEEDDEIEEEGEETGEKALTDEKKQEMIGNLYLYLSIYLLYKNYPSGHPFCCLPNDLSFSLL